MHAWDVSSGTNDTISIRGSYGMLNGEAHEIVYANDPFAGRYKLSDLKWDLSPLEMAGLVMSCKLSDLWSLHAGAWTSLNGGNGQMLDYDWQFPGLPWSDRSISDDTVLSSYMADINVTRRIFAQGSIVFSGVIGYKQDFWKWDDHVLDFLYSVNGFRDYHATGDGSTMVDYQQLYRIPYVGLQSDGLWGAFVLNAYLLYSPLVLAQDQDYHIARNIHYKETFSGGNYIGAGVAAQYDITSALFISAAFDFQTIPEFTGDLQQTDASGNTSSFNGAAGIAHTSSLLSVSMGMRF